MPHRLRNSIATLLLSILAACGGGNEGNNDPFNYVDVGDPETYRKEHQAKIDALRVTNRDLVASFYERLPNELTVVRGFTASQCGGTARHYSARKGPNKLAHIELNLFFSLDAGLGDQGPAHYQKVAACFSDVSKMWERSGIELVINSRSGLAADYVELIRNLSDEAKPFKVILFAGQKRTNAGEYYVAAEGDHLCSTVAHELGHVMGLPDEYSEPGTCREEIYSEYSQTPYNVMAAPSDLSVTDPYPRNIREILDPLVNRS